MASTLADDLFALAITAQYDKRDKERQDAERIVDEYPEWTMEIMATLKERAAKGETYYRYPIDQNRGVDGQIHACAVMKVFEQKHGFYVTPAMDSTTIDLDSPTILALTFSWDKRKPAPTSVPK